MRGSSCSCCRMSSEECMPFMLLPFSLHEHMQAQEKTGWHRWAGDGASQRRSGRPCHVMAPPSWNAEHSCRGEIISLLLP